MIAYKDGSPGFGEIRHAAHLVGDSEMTEHSAAEVGATQPMVDTKHFVELILTYDALHPSHQRAWNKAVMTRQPLTQDCVQVNAYYIR